MDLLPRSKVISLFGVSQKTLTTWHDEGILTHEQAKPGDLIFYHPARVQAALDKAKRVGTFTLVVEDLLKCRQGLHSTDDAADLLKMSRRTLMYAVANSHEWVQALRLQRRWYILDSCIVARMKMLGLR